MEPSFHGQLSEKPVANLIGEIADRRVSGLLRLRRDESAKAIFFEAGAPVYASSNAPDEQLEHRLLQGGLVAAELIVEAKRRNLTPQELGWNLVEVEALSQRAMEEAIRQLAADIILSVFEWEHGEYVFYEDMDHGLGPKLNWTRAESVLAAARRAAKMDSVASVIAPEDGRVVQTNASQDSIAGGATLNSLEAFVLSSILAPTTVREVATLTGLPESESRSAICVLLVLGLLKLEDNGEQFEKDGFESDSLEDRKEPESQAVEDSSIAGASVESQSEASVESQSGASVESQSASVESVLALVVSKLSSIASADLYEVLGVDKYAPNSRITIAYQEMNETFASFHSRWPDHLGLSESLEAIIEKIDEAYETLRDPGKRRVYDRPAVASVRRQPAAKTSKAAKPVTKPAPRRQPIPLSATPDPLPPPPSPSNGNENPVLNSSTQAAAVKKAPSKMASGKMAPSKIEPSFDPASVAEEYYRKGRKRFDRRDFNGALHFLREALKLDPSQARYHYHIGVTLSTMAQVHNLRHSHTHEVGCHVTCSMGGDLARNPKLRREAEQHMLKAAELDRSNPEITLRLAKLYQEAGMEKKAGHYFLETLLLDATNPVALRELGASEKPVEKSSANSGRLDR